MSDPIPRGTWVMVANKIPIPPEKWIGPRRYLYPFQEGLDRELHATDTTNELWKYVRQATTEEIKMPTPQQQILVKEEIKELCKRGNITLIEYQTLRMNSYERVYIVQFLNTEAFLHVCKTALANVTWAPTFPTTYEEVIVTNLFPELLTRIQQARL